jgi:hypothetical protein
MRDLPSLLMAMAYRLNPLQWLSMCFTMSAEFPVKSMA